MTKSDLTERIKRRLGYPMIKVELDTSQIHDAIDFSRSKWLKWAVGNATQETYFTMAVSAGQTIYDLPMGVTEVISYDDHGGTGGINTLFTMDNYLYSRGAFSPIASPYGDTSGHSYGYDYGMISYHIARGFLDDVERYTPSKYNWKYHRYTNQLEIHPAPASGNSLTVTVDGVDVAIDSPGFILLRTMMVEGSSLSDTWTSGDSNEYFYESTWILDYSTALCKITLGTIRRKFANFGSIGNVGISLDGDSLVSEGKEEKATLDETLMLEEVYEGLDISIG
jgi:hypothetical protein